MRRLLLASALLLLYPRPPAQAQAIDLSEGWRFRTGNDTTWTAPTSADTAWAPIRVGVPWEEAGHPGYDGYGWYRTSVVVPAAWRTSGNAYLEEGGELWLRLGFIDGADVAYVNGHRVGATGRLPPDYYGDWATERVYRVPADVVRWGEANTVAVQTFDAGGDGGMAAGPYRLALPTWRDYFTAALQPERDDGTFPLGALMAFAITLENAGIEPVEGTLTWRVVADEGGLLAVDSQRVAVPVGRAEAVPARFEPPEPGFYQVRYAFDVGDGAPLADARTLGYAPTDVRPPLTRPADFEAFWDRTRAELAAVPPQFQMTRLDSLSTDVYTMHLVEMRSLGDVRVRGWYRMPTGRGPHPALLQVVGYGPDGLGPPPTSEDGPLAGFAVFALNIRGQGNSRQDVRPDFPGYLVEGLHDEAAYVYRGAYMDCVRALDFLASRPEVDPDRIAVEGGSQGGALALATAALGERIALAAPDVPFLGDMGTFLRIAPWPSSEFLAYASRPGRTLGDVLGVLSYFDVMNLAPWIRSPVLMSSGLQDAICPPHTNFAAFNRIRAEKAYVLYPEAGHEGGRDLHRQRKLAWIRDHFGM